MSPLAHSNKCKHPKLKHMLTFKDGDEKIYCCLVCKAVVSSRELNRGEMLV
jgi:hypothetical protein